MIVVAVLESEALLLSLTREAAFLVAGAGGPATARLARVGAAGGGMAVWASLLAARDAGPALFTGLSGTVSMVGALIGEVGRAVNDLGGEPTALRGDTGKVRELWDFGEST